MRELARTGRKHTAEIVGREIAWLRESGIESINIDLIAGLPGQTRQSWSDSLEWIEKLAVPHASVYMLEVDQDSRLGREILAGGARYGAADVPSDDEIGEFYEVAVERLASAGLTRYEISNFARPGFESHHNLKYWRREPYLGFGADAHSFDGIWRWQNVETAAEYVESHKNGRSPAASRTAADPAEHFFLGLRMSEGIDADWSSHAAAIEDFARQGLVHIEGRRLRLTSRGIMLSNEVFAEFV
jgi:oxygen-independent coproporphyrinogen-3 oxidase